jgi:heme a synthase
MVLACATFPLLWVGGLVTTTNSGMAVPDWPNTYGYNLFLYPWQSWLAGPWDLFIEHGHRLLASAVGLLTICLLMLLLRSDSRVWMKGLGFAALALVIFQGVLGGMRVLLDERTLAMLHGCTGPLFFAVTIALAVFTSRTWMTGEQQFDVPAAGNIRRLAMATALLSYLQILLGAVLRHVPVDAQPGTFLLAVKSHLFLAAVLTIHILVLAGVVLYRLRHARPINYLAAALAALVVCQVLLGIATWMEKFALPTWAAGWMSPHPVPVREGGWLQTHIITAHVATGSLILGVAVALALFAQRLLPSSAKFSAMQTKLGTAT